MLNKLYTLVEQGTQTDLVLDYIFDEVDELLNSGKFKECDKVLQDVDLSKLSVVVMLAFVTTTYVAQRVLPSRKELFLRTEKELQKRMTKEEAKELMRGLN